MKKLLTTAALAVATMTISPVAVHAAGADTPVQAPSTPTAGSVFEDCVNAGMTWNMWLVDNGHIDQDQYEANKWQIIKGCLDGL